MQPNRLSAKELATGRWGYILPALGISEDFLRDKHGPCPVCGGKDRYRYDDLEGRGSWICNQCGPGDGYKLLELVNGWSFTHALGEVRRLLGDSPMPAAMVQAPKADDLQRKVAAMRRVWDASLHVEKGDPVWTYLNRRVGLEIVPACLRFHPALAYRHEDGEITHHPAMVAAVTYPDGMGASLHRTYLTSDGRKAAVPSAKKLMPGKPLQTASIKLGAYSDVLGVAEGIETALAASRRFGFPVWSCVSSGLLEAWEPPADLGRVVVLGDNDTKFAGQAAAYRIAHKLACKGVAVEVRVPDAAGRDWADE